LQFLQNKIKTNILNSHFFIARIITHLGYRQNQEVERAHGLKIAIFVKMFLHVSNLLHVPMQLSKAPTS
jgi:uncharacterized membrane protein YecN with MAPEG domain